MHALQGQSHIKMHFNHNSPKMLVAERTRLIYFHILQCIPISCS